MLSVTKLSVTPLHCYSISVSVFILQLHFFYQQSLFLYKYKFSFFFLCNKRLFVILDKKSCPECPINDAVYQDFHSWTNCFPSINQLSYYLSIDANDTSSHSKRGKTPDIWHRLELASYLKDTVERVKRWLATFNPLMPGGNKKVKTE